MPYLDKMVFRLIPDQNTILKDFQANSITSAWFLDVTKTPAYKAPGNYHFVVNPAASNFEAIVLNVNNPVLKDVKDPSRRWRMAIDYNALIQTAAWTSYCRCVPIMGRPMFQAIRPMQRARSIIQRLPMPCWTRWVGQRL